MMLVMRTTVTLDSDVELKLQRLMRERRITFKEAVNSTLRAGLGIGDDGPGRAKAKGDYSFPTYSMGEPLMDLTHANRIAEELEDEAILQKLALGK